MFAHDLDEFIRLYVGALFPAIAVSISLRGERVTDAAWGWIDPDTQQIPVTTHTRFDFASLTKLFTTTSLLTAISEGRAALDTPLIEIMPSFGAVTPRPIDGGQDPHTKQTAPTAPERAGETVDPARVTLFHLLTHTSGLPPWRDVYRAAGDAPPPLTAIDPIPRAARWARALEALCGYAFVGQPREAVRYSDVGFMLLGEAVSRLAGSPGDLQPATADTLRRLTLDEIDYRPIEAGIALEAVAPTEIDPTWRKRRVWGEVHDENACGVGGVSGHAGLFGTARAVARFGELWAAGAVPGIAPELIAAAVREQAVTEDERRGLGWMIRSRRGSSAGDRLSEHAYGHTGFVGNSLWIDPEPGLVVACLTNHVYNGRERGGMAEFRRALHDFVWDYLCAPDAKGAR